MSFLLVVHANGLSIFTVIPLIFLWAGMASPKARKMEFCFYPSMEFLLRQQRGKKLEKKTLLFHVPLCDFWHFSHPSVKSGFRPSTLKRWNSLGGLNESCQTCPYVYFAIFHLDLHKFGYWILPAFYWSLVVLFVHRQKKCFCLVAHCHIALAMTPKKHIEEL